MKVNENAKKTFLSIVARKAVHSSVKSANTTCAAFQYQTKSSEAVKKLRKF